ncbi:YceI family protein [Sphaerisporangium sp. NPDC088356]|uniref:YceI family protein n=1 Tax=Sphaerisporangium sp. NPDC088356 TaxID=3154871 RepID=UPI0034138514
MSTSTLSPELTGQYQIDTSHSRLGFVARHAMVTKVHGAFNEFEGTAYLDAADPSKSHAKVTIDVASVDTRNDQRDGHLRTNDFFDAPNFPVITFVSTAVEQVGATEFRLTGDLTIKDVTRSISIDFEYTGSAKDAYGAERAGFEGRTVVNRKDFGINFNAVLEAGGVMVSEKITLEFDISAVKVTPAA